MNVVVSQLRPLSLSFFLILFLILSFSLCPPHPLSLSYLPFFPPLERRKKASAWEKNLLYPIVMLILLTGTVSIQVDSTAASHSH